jgi:hypothetical protein
MFEEDDVLDMFEGKKVDSPNQPPLQFSPMVSQQELIFGKSTNQLS